jgi:hypothetical protein
MTSLIITEWMPLEPASPGWLSAKQLDAVLASDNVDAVVPGTMYDKTLFAEMRELFVTNFMYSQNHPGIKRYARVQGSSSLYTIMAFATKQDAADYQTNIASAPFYASYEHTRDQFLSLVRVQMTVHAIVTLPSDLTTEQIDALTETQLLEVLTAA